MNTNLTQHPLLFAAAVAAAALLSAGSVMAQQTTPDQFLAVVVPGTAQRAEVKADLQSFRASGETSPWSRDYVQRVASSQPRAAVKAETLRAIKNNEVVNHGEYYGIAPAQRQQVAAISR